MNKRNITAAVCMVLHCCCYLEAVDVGLVLLLGAGLPVALQ